MDYLQRFEGINFGHKTLNERFNRTLRQLAGDPEGSINKACGEPSQSKAAYRMIANEKLREETIISTHRDVTLEHIRTSGEPVVLVPQDTTEFNYTHLEHTSGLGCIGSNENLRGILMHSAIAVTPQGGILGLLGQQLWIRPEEERGKKRTRKQRLIEDKESFRWLETMEQAESGDHGEAQLIHICDREGDIYEFFDKAAREGCLFLIRRTYNRNTGESDKIETYLNSQPSAGMYQGNSIYL